MASPTAPPPVWAVIAELYGACRTHGTKPFREQRARAVARLAEPGLSAEEMEATRREIGMLDGLRRNEAGGTLMTICGVLGPE